MVKVALRSRKLFEVRRMLGLPEKRTDTAYLVHCVLGELFQDNAPKPFALDGEGGGLLFVLGYTELGMDALRGIAQAYASPELYSVCDFDRSHSKPMPERYPEHHRFDFELRVCPIIRKREGGRSGKSTELDAFLARALGTLGGEEISREDTYRMWLSARFEGQGGARLLEAHMKRFELTKMMRRTQAQRRGGQRRAHGLTRPDATFMGRLEVAHEEKFAELLRRGIGRHKSFGFGMVKLRRAR